MARGGRGRLKLVVDACLWIDLNFGGLISELFQLPHEIISPDVIIAELEGFDAKVLKKLGLVEVSLTPDEFLILVELIKKYPKPGINDLTALTIAKSHGLRLLTGDADLRKAAETEGIRATGVLGVLDSMIAHKIINPKRAAIALEEMLKNKARLPKAECQRRLKKWQDLAS